MAPHLRCGPPAWTDCICFCIRMEMFVFAAVAARPPRLEDYAMEYCDQAPAPMPEAMRAPAPAPRARAQGRVQVCQAARRDRRILAQASGCSKHRASVKCVQLDIET